MVEMVNITLFLDEQGLITSWGTSMKSLDDTPTLDIKLPFNHPLLTGKEPFSFYRVVDGELTYSEELALSETKKQKIAELLRIKDDLVDSGFCYIIKGIEYQVTYTKEDQDYLHAIYNKLLLISEENVTVSLKVKGTNMPLGIADVVLTPDEFMVLYTYADLIMKWKESKCTDLLEPYINTLTTIEEVNKVTWDTLPDTTIPEIPDVTFHSKLKEEFSKLSNSQLKLQANIDEIMELLWSSI